jgi:molecular chaperone GrpE
MPKKTTEKKTSPKKKTISSLSKEIDRLNEINSKYEEDNLELKNSYDKQKDKNIRLLAEFDNYKRRTRDEKKHLNHYSGEGIILSLLPVLDDIERIIENSDKSDKDSIKEAVQLLSSKLVKTLKEKSIESFDSLGESFNPELHEALMSEAGEEDDIIVKEFEKGYKYHDRIIRHAKVVVSKKS